jgi:hypothetical protein
MAVRKLSLSLFSPKSRGSKQGAPRTTSISSPPSVTRRPVCECQPLMISRSHGLPARCPICGAQIRSKENANSADGLGVSS